MNYCPNCGHHLASQAAETVVVVQSCPNEPHCEWRKIREGWRCSHGVVAPTHPNGWCDQGCCR